MDRRQSVAPSTSYRWRSRSMATEDQENSRGQASLDQGILPSAMRTATAATRQLKKMTKMLSIDRTKEVLRVALEDNDRVEYVRLACEHEELVKEAKQLRGFVVELCERYEAARSLDPIRRYKRMQSMAKTIVLQLRVNDPGAAAGGEAGNGSVDSAGGGGGALIVGDVLQSSVKQKEMRLKHEKAARVLSNEQIQSDILKFHSENRELRCRIEATTDAINNLDSVYNSTKSEPFVKRYAILKEAIREMEKFADTSANHT
ncbi:unnamed protein product [Mesocestoides corti]|nr:unnamed protein product [Mesocestoides corti]